MTDINHFLEPGEIIQKKQNCALDQGLGNQSDGTLYLTNQQLIFQIQQSGMARGLDLQIQGQRDVKVEFIYIPLNLVRGVEKKVSALKFKLRRLSFKRRAPREETSKQYSQENLKHHTIKEKIVIREIVKIKCSYCGSLYEQTSNRCPHCGARVSIKK